MEPRPPDATTRTILVWDVPVRLVHWLQAALVATSVLTGFTGGNALRFHRLSGYAILTLVLFRVLWGFAGSHHARFRSFVRGPRAVAAFVRDTIALRRPLHAGHNPLAGWMTVALLAALLVQATTGLFANDDIFFEGPLASLVSRGLSARITRVHEANAFVLLALVAMHVAAVLFHLVVERQNHLTPMFTGRKPWPGGVVEPQTRQTRPWMAAALFVVASAVVAFVVNAPGAGRAGGSP